MVLVSANLKKVKWYHVKRYHDGTIWKWAQKNFSGEIIPFFAKFLLTTKVVSNSLEMGKWPWVPFNFFGTVSQCRLTLENSTRKNRSETVRYFHE
jgi:hypothetical protein